MRTFATQIMQLVAIGLQARRLLRKAIKGGLREGQDFRLDERKGRRNAHEQLHGAIIHALVLAIGRIFVFAHSRIHKERFQLLIHLVAFLQHV